MTARGRTATPGPSADLAGFPARFVDGSWHRAHVDRGGKDRGCWWFASLQPGQDPDTGGRFDLPAPHGTCYLASTQAAAARERLGSQVRKVSGRESVLASLTDGVVVSTTTLPAPVRAANLPVRAAERWVDRSLSSGMGYAAPQAWAVGWHAAGLGGVLYLPRHTSGSRVRALAVFGRAGRPRPLPQVERSAPLADVLSADGIRLVPAPHTAPVLDPGSPPPAL